MTTAKDKQPHDQNRRFADQIKSWLPVVISIGGIIIGYVLFKTNTEYRLNSAEDNISQLQHNLTETRQTIATLREININFNSRLKVLERQPIGDIND